MRFSTAALIIEGEMIYWFRKTWHDGHIHEEDSTFDKSDFDTDRWD